MTDWRRESHAGCLHRGRIDALFLASNEFVNTMTQAPQVEQLLPLKAEENERPSHHGTTSMSPMLASCWMP
ncbi:MAG: hypothetical protein CM15mP74_13220 [Halieaceae bacterium]|nr:MAG: hypothetical protein CM15mP74_13220 [Halieaceae bacterium]